MPPAPSDFTHAPDGPAIEAAAALIAPWVRLTPVIAADLGGHPLTLKLECLQVSGTFKARGAFTRLLGAQLAASPPSLAAALPPALASSAWWMYLGGPIGVVYIASGIALVRTLGSATYFQCISCWRRPSSTPLAQPWASPPPPSRLSAAWASCWSPQLRWPCRGTTGATSRGGRGWWRAKEVVA